MSGIGSKKKTKAENNGLLAFWQQFSPYIVSVPYFFVVCLLSPSTSKAMGIAIAGTAAVLGMIFFERLRDRLTPAVLALAAYVLMNGLSTSYAIAGKFALYEFLKVLSSFGLALLLLLAAPGKGERPARWIATVLGFTAVFGALVSLDMISVHRFSDAVLAFLAKSTPDYGVLERGVFSSRLGTVFENPNIFGGFSGIGILLLLELANTAENRWTRFLNCAGLFVASLAFLLCVSRGSILAIACGFVILIVLEKPERRPALLVLMFFTLVSELFSTMIIVQEKLVGEDGIDKAPFYCAVFGSLGLAAVDQFTGWFLAQKPKAGKWVAPVGAVLAVLFVGFIVAAWKLTEPLELEAGQGVQRAAYLDPGEYTVNIESDAPVEISVSSQNLVEGNIVGYTTVYSSSESSGTFEIPDGSQVAFFYVAAIDHAVTVTSVAYEGPIQGELPLKYMLLPEIIADPLQGILANKSAYDRFVIFEDGIKLFQRKPVLGLGLGGFENAVRSVQSINYTTKYVHNHYIQALCDTGILGLLLFLTLLLICAVSVFLAWRCKGEAALVPAVGAALVFMAVHGAVEVDFSVYPCLAMYYPALVLLGLDCGVACPSFDVKKTVKTFALPAICCSFLVFDGLFFGNMIAARTVAAENTFASLERAAKLDKFEWADYLLTYVEQSTGAEADEHVRERAKVYAERLSRIESNSAALILTRYYFQTREVEKAFAMLEKHVTYVPADGAEWSKAFHVLAEFDDGSEGFRAFALKLYAQMNTWNEEHYIRSEEHYSEVGIDSKAREYLARYDTGGEST